MCIRKWSSPVNPVPSTSHALCNYRGEKREHKKWGTKVHTWSDQGRGEQRGGPHASACDAPSAVLQEENEYREKRRNELIDLCARYGIAEKTRAERTCKPYALLCYAYDVNESLNATCCQTARLSTRPKVPRPQTHILKDGITGEQVDLNSLLKSVSMRV